MPPSRFRIAVRPGRRVRHHDIRVAWDLIPEHGGFPRFIPEGPISFELGMRRSEYFEGRLWPVRSSQPNYGRLMLKKDDRRARDELDASLWIFNIGAMETSSMLGIECRIESDIVVACSFSNLADEKGTGRRIVGHQRQKLTTNDDFDLKVGLGDPRHRLPQLRHAAVVRQVAGVDQDIARGHLEARLGGCVAMGVGDADEASLAVHLVLL